MAVSKTLTLKKKRPYLIAYYAALGAVGLMIGVLGPTLGQLASQIGTDLKGISAILIARPLGYMLGSFLVGRLLDRLPGHPILAWSCGLAALTLALAPLAPSLGLLFALMLVMGIFDANLDVGGNTLLVWVYRDKAAPYLNGLHFAFGVGAFAAPLIVAQALSWTGGIAWTYWTLALIIGGMAPFLAMLPSPPHDAAHAAAKAAKVRWGLVGLFVLFAMFYSAAEAGFGNWIYSYALATKLEDAPHAAYLTSLFWGTLTLGRLASIPLAAKFKSVTLIGVDLVLCLIGLSLPMIFADSRAALWIGTAITGLAMASMFPTALNLAQERMPLPGKVTSLFFVGLSLGSISLPWAIGRNFESYGAWIVPAAIFSAVVALTFIFVLLAKAPRRRRGV